MATIINMVDIHIDKKIHEVCKIINYTLDIFAKDGFFLNEIEKNDFILLAASQLKKKINNEDFIELRLKDNFLYDFAYQVNTVGDLKMDFTWVTDDAFQNKKFLELFSNYRRSLNCKKDEFKIKEILCEKKFRGETGNQIEIPNITFIV